MRVRLGSQRQTARLANGFTAKAEIVWGPMAYAMMGGILIGTALTLLFLPALYVAWFRIPAPEAKADPALEIEQLRAQITP